MKFSAFHLQVKPSSRADSSLYTLHNVSYVVNADHRLDAGHSAPRNDGHITFAFFVFYFVLCRRFLDVLFFFSFALSDPFIPSLIEKRNRCSMGHI